MTTNINLPGTTAATDYYMEVSRGNIPGAKGVNKFGSNPAVSGAEDIWDGGGDWTAPTEPRVHALSSTDSNDTATGTGMRTLQVEGLDANWEEQSEVVTLSSAGAVNTVGVYARVHRMYGITFGSSATNAGVISAVAVGDATVTAAIVAGSGQTLMAIYSVPAGKTAFLVGAGGGVSKFSGASTMNVAMQLVVRRNANAPNAGWTDSWRGGLALQGTSTFNAHRPPPAPIGAYTDIKVRAREISATSEVSAWFDLVLIDD